MTGDSHRKIIKITGAMLLILAVCLVVVLALHEAGAGRVYPENETGITLCINEVMYSNLGATLDADGDNSDWIELWNYGEETVDLTGMTIADHVGGKDRWAIPEGELQPSQYLIIWASGKDKISESGELHTNFLINPNDTITLYDANGDCVDELYLGASVQPGISVGRPVKDPQVYALLSNASPGKANNAMVLSYVTNVDPSLKGVGFSQEAGIYSEAFELSLFTEDEGAVILYTLDGSVPDKDSYVYKEPIVIKDHSDEPNNIGNTKTTPNYEMNYKWENSNLYKGTVVRARTMKDGALSEEITTKSFFIAPDTGFDIVSLSVDPEEMFDEQNGIYVPGETYYIWKKYNKESTNTVFPPGNYSGADKIKGNVEIFDADGDRLADNEVTVRIMGAASRSYAAKALKLTMDENKKSFDGSMLTLLPAEGEMNQLALRPSGTDFNKTMFADILAQSIVADEMNVTYIGAEPSVLFINGEYWGIHNIREVYNEEYFHKHYGVDEKSIALIELNTSLDSGAPSISAGTEEDLAEYYELVEFIKNNDLSVQENYDYVAEHIDVDCFMDYYIAEMYYGNDDWPGNNYRIWRSDDETTEYGDNRWRPVLYDLDDAFLNTEFNTIEYLLTEDYDESVLDGINLHYDDNREIILGLIQNQGFRDRFFERFEECLDTVFEEDRVVERLVSMVAVYAPEMEDHFARWHTADGWLKKIKSMIKPSRSESDMYNYDWWFEKVDDMRDFARKRPDIMRQYIREYLGN